MMNDKREIKENIIFNIAFLAILSFPLAILAFPFLISFTAGGNCREMKIEGYKVDRFGIDKFYPGTYEEVRELVPTSPIYQTYRINHSCIN